MASITASIHYSNHSQSQKGSFIQAPPSPSPAHYNPLQNTTNMHVLGPTAMSAPPTPSRVAPPLSMYNKNNYTLNGSNHSPLMQLGSNHASPHMMGQHSGHGNGMNKRAIMQPNHKVASSRAILMNARQSEASYLSPVPHRASVRQSLVGFDPLLSDTTAGVTPSRRAANAGVSTATPSRRITAPLLTAKISPPPPSLSPNQQARQTLTTPPQAQITTDKKQHRKGVQSFCISDLRSISQDAAEQERLNAMMIDRSSNEEEENRSSSPGSREGSPTPGVVHRQAPPTPFKSPISLGLRGKSSSPKQDRKGTPKKEIENSKQDKRSSGTPPRSGRLPWSKKGHRRTRSLESREDIPAAQKAVEGSRLSSIPTTPKAERKSSMYPSIVQDLMGLKLASLQIPSLAKPSPTSFLTGKEDEVVRTCEQPAPHQIEIPTLPEFVVTARLNEFVENHRRVDQNFDLRQWVGLDRMDLRQVKIPEHVPIAHSLLECGDDVCLQGVITKGSSADERLEVVVFEGQRQFIAVFRGTTEQQSKAGSKSKKKAVPLDKEHETVEVYQCFLEEYMKLEPECFALLDKLTEEHPFCDVVFTGHSFGAAMATLAAFRYANARPMMRASCLTLASPKVGFSLFRQMVNSLPNLKVMRLEFGQDGKCQLPSVGGSHVGNTLVLKGSLGYNSLKTTQPVLAYKFDTPKHKKFKTTHPDLRSYVTALEEVARLGLPWAKDFVGTSGQGVVINNEARQVV
jgi:hypothetical protein